MLHPKHPNVKLFITKPTDYKFSQNHKFMMNKSAYISYHFIKEYQHIKISIMRN